MKRNRINRIFIFTLSFAVFLNSTGVFLLNYFETEMHRENEYSAGNLKDSRMLFLSVAEFISIAWIGTHDFIYDGNVYDYDTVFYADGKINLLCHADNEETVLKNAMASNFDNAGKNIPASKSLKEFLKLFRSDEKNVCAEIYLAESVSFNYSFYKRQFPAAVVLSPNSPPPENFF